MKRQTARWVQKAEDDWRAAHKLAKERPPLHDLVCFHCQQAAEKYLKALLQDGGAFVPKTHSLKNLLGLLLPDHAALAPLRRSLLSLSRYAVDFRYPGPRATRRQMLAALRHMDEVRRVARDYLSISE